MTLDDATAEIDKMLEARWDALALRMIADGMDPDEVCDEPSPADGPWSRVSFNWILQRQKELDLQWRDEVLAKVRAWLLSGR
jgi:hypothetical protein